MEFHGKPSQHLPKRCKFFTACRQAPTLWRWHTHLKKNVAVCALCAGSNPYLAAQAGD